MTDGELKMTDKELVAPDLNVGRHGKHRKS